MVATRRGFDIEESCRGLSQRFLARPRPQCSIVRIQIIGLALTASLVVLSAPVLTGRCCLEVVALALYVAAIDTWPNNWAASRRHGRARFRRFSKIDNRNVGGEISCA